jgi:hypothetical protein
MTVIWVWVKLGRASMLKAQGAALQHLSIMLFQAHGSLTQNMIRTSRYGTGLGEKAATCPDDRTTTGMCGQD